MNQIRVTNPYRFEPLFSTIGGETLPESSFLLNSNTFIYMKRARTGAKTNLMKSNIELLLVTDFAGSF